MALFIEDAYDILRLIHPHCDFVVQMDQSAGHDKRREDGLEAKEMSLKWGAGKNMRQTIVTDNGPYVATHLVDQPQSMKFKDSDAGSFYFTERERELQKYPVATGRMKVRKKNRKELLE